MKKSLTFFYTPTCFDSPSTKLLPMNSNFTRRRWLPALGVLTLLGLSHLAYSQCDISAPGAPVNIQLTVDPISGTAQFDASIAGLYVTSGNCAGILGLAARQFRYYTDDTRTTLYQPSTLQNIPILLGGGQQQVVNFDCDDVGNGVDIWVAVNDGSVPFQKSSESEAVVFNVSIIDVTAPHINAPNNLTVFANANCQATNIPNIDMSGVVKISNNPMLMPRQYTDNCLADVQIGYQLDFGNNGSVEKTVLLDNDAGQEVFPAGVTRVIYSAQDGNSNITQDFFLITVTDNTPPSVSCPANQSVGTSASTCNAVVTNIQATGVAENCTPISSLTWAITGATVASNVNDASGTTFNQGVSTVTYTVTDQTAQTGTCAFTITVTDDDPPVLSNCPQNTTVSANPVSCTYTVVGTGFNATATDNCALQSITNSKDGTNTLNGEVFPIGPTSVTWTAQDVQGLISTCSFTLNVIDNTVPNVNFNRTYTVNVTPGDCSKVVTVDRPDANDPSGIVDCSGPIVIAQGVPVVNGIADPNFLNGAPAYNPALSPNEITVQFPVGITVIPYTWTDDDNNIQNGTITVTVIENVAPTALCSASPVVLTLAPNNGTTTLSPSAVNAGSNDNCGQVSLALSKTNYTCTDIGTSTVTLTVTDKAGNTATCTAQVQVSDVTAPTLQCPLSRTVNANTNCNTTVSGLTMMLELNPADVGPGEFFDNAGACGNFVRQYRLSGAEVKAFPAPGVSDIGGLSTETFVLGTTTVTIRVYDPSGNVSTCSFDITVQDKTGPQYTSGQAAGTTINVNANVGGCIAQAAWTVPAFTDLCSPGVTVMSSHNPGAFFPFGPTVVTYTAMDASGNSTIHMFTVNVIDTQKPVAKCADITVSLNNNGQVTVPVQDIDNGSTDNCFFNYTISSYAFTCSDLGENDVTMTIVDGSNNSASCTSTITVEDITPPTPVCATLQPLALGANGTVTVQASAFDGGSTDNCPGGFTYDISVNGSGFATSFTFDCADVNVPQNVTLRVFDGSLNSASCPTTVSIKDLQVPSFTTPANITVACGSISPTITGTPSNLADNCPGSLTFSSIDIFNNASQTPCNDRDITRVWTVTDAAGNTSTGSQRIIIDDNVAPVFNMKPTIVTQTNSGDFCYGPFTAKVTTDSVSDNCSAFVLMTVAYTVDYPADAAQYGFTDIPQTTGSMVPNATFPIGTTQILWRVTDACGNSALFTQNVVVIDTKAPVFKQPFANRCSQTFNLVNTPGECSSLYVWNRPTNFFSGLGQVDIFECPLTDITVTETISDPSVQQFIDVVNPFVFNTANTQVVVQFPIGSTTVTYVAKDGQNNSSVCSFTVVVTDNEDPNLNCPANQVLPTTCPDAVVPNYLTQAQVTDNCTTDLTLSQTPLAGATLSSLFGAMPMPGQTFTVTITAEDSNPNNDVTCTFTVTLQDGQAPIPVVNFLPPIVGFCGADTVYAPLAIDACNANDSIWGTPSASVGQFLNTDPPSYFLNPGNYVITWAYNDGNGNISTQQQFISFLNDNFPPEAKCKPAFNLNLDPSGFASINLGLIDNGSNDPNACGPITRALNKTSFTCNDLGTNVITLTVTDDGGNTATCNTTITVKDVTAPVLPPIPNNITVQACANIPPPANLNTSDACDNDVDVDLTIVSTQDTSGFDKYNYTITRTWILTDDSGNSTGGTQVITVTDTNDPVFSAAAPDTVVVVTDFTRITCDDTVSVNILPFLSDCATGLDLAVTNDRNPAQGGNFSGLFGVGNHLLVFTATDISGNAAQYTVVVQVKDGTVPTAACINGISVALNPSGIVNIPAQVFNAGSFDNCTNQLNLTVQRLGASASNPAAAVLFDCDDADGSTQHPVQLNVVDAAGNISSCQTYVVLQDNVSPSITSCPPSKSLQCEEDTSPQIHGQALANDNCPNNVSITFQDTLLPGTGNACVLLQRTWIAADLAENTVTCIQTFSISDTVAPVLSSTPGNDTIACGEALPAVPVLTATDNCTDSVTVDLLVDTVGVVPGVCGQYNFSVRRTWTAEDGCGNAISHTQLIVVRDQSAPTFTNMPDTITLFTDDFPNAIDCKLPLDLDAADYLEDCADLSELLVTNSSPFGDSSSIAGGNLPEGAYKFYFSAIDPCGNVGLDSVVVNIIDNTTPTMVCTDKIDITLPSSAIATIDADDLDLNSSDNCGIDTFLLSQNVFDCGDLGINEVTLTAVDFSGNTNTCVVDVEVLPGNVAGFDITVTSTPETSFGLNNGTATAATIGGSGNFDFEWDNAETTATITNLAAGVYRVTVIDQTTGCESADSVTVESGLLLTVTVGEVGGAWGEIVKVPVTVDNFIDIVGFTFTLDVVDPSVGIVVGTTDVNPILDPNFSSSVIGNGVGIFWAEPSITPTDLPNGTLLFNLEVLINNAPLGSISPVDVTGVPVDIEFQQDSSGNTIAIPVDVDNGFVEVTDTVGQNNVTIAGDIKTWINPENPASVETPLKNVTVNLTGTQSAQVVRDSTYIFGLPQSSNTVVRLSKKTVGNAGVTSADLLRIVNHIFGDTLPSPYMWIAADINDDKKVSLADYLLIQRLVLGVDTVLLQGPTWKFVPKAHIFPPISTLPFGPLSAPYPDSISHTPADVDYLDDDFVAIRMGDVNGNTPVNLTSTVSSRYESPDALYFRVADQSIEAGSVIKVPFLAGNFTDRQAYQATLNFNPAVLAVENIELGALPKHGMDNFGLAHVSKGYLTTNWVNREATTLAAGETLFTVQFRVLSSTAALSDVLHLSSDVTRAESYTLSGETTPVELRFEQLGVETAVFALHQNQPNPFDGSTLVGLHMPEAGNATFRVYNAQGQVVKTIDGWFAKGYNQIRLSDSDLGNAGIYWYELEYGQHIARKKMVLIK